MAKARGLGLLSGSAIYSDMETYATSDASCRTAVLRYLSAWTSEIHRLGYIAGVYAQLASGAHDLAGVYGSASYARPDALWIARYDGSTSLTGWAGIPDSGWAARQRAKQYSNSHNESYGGVTLSIDNDQVNAPAATVGFGYSVTSSTVLNGRAGPATTYPVVNTHAPGSALTIACQAPGMKTGTTTVWDKLVRRNLCHRLLRQHPLEDGLQRTAATLQLSLPGQRRRRRQGAHRTWRQQPRCRPAVSRRASAGQLPAAGQHDPYHSNLGQADRRPLGYRLLRRQPEQDHLQQARAPLLSVFE